MIGWWDVRFLTDRDPDDRIGGEIREDTKGIQVQMYLSLEDGQPVIEIDTSEYTGEIRVYVNDGKIYGRDPDKTEED